MDELLSLGPRQGLQEPHQGSVTCEGGHQADQGVQGDQGHLGYQGDQGGPRLLVEHISQLSEPDCRFCQHPAPHLDCNKINIYSGGTPVLVRFPCTGKDWQSFLPSLLMMRECCTLSLCYLGAETDDQHRNPNINTKFIWLGN